MDRQRVKANEQVCGWSQRRNSQPRQAHCTLVGKDGLRSLLLRAAATAACWRATAVSLASAAPPTAALRAHSRLVVVLRRKLRSSNGGRCIRLRNQLRRLYSAQQTAPVRCCGAGEAGQSQRCAAGVGEVEEGDDEGLVAEGEIYDGAAAQERAEGGRIKSGKGRCKRR